MNRLAKRISPIWISPLVALSVAGCGGLLTSRGLNLTGGSVPVGTSKAAVIVDPGSSADPSLEATVALVPSLAGSPSRMTTPGPTTPLPPVTDPPPGGGNPPPGPIFPTTPGGSSVGAYREYLFDNLPAGPYSLKVSVPDSAAFSNYEWPFELPGDSMARAVAALLPSTFDADTVGEVQISPLHVTVSPGETVRFFGAATDYLGAQVPHSVSFMLIGDTGELAPRGVFTARRYGKSRLIAWMNGKSAAADITVVP